MPPWEGVARPRERLLQAGFTACFTACFIAYEKGAPHESRTRSCGSSVR